MLFTALTVVYVLVAALMIGFILVQRGPGAQAGSGFGAGASGTVFGARGAANFLTRSTAVLGTLFFVLSMGMAYLIMDAGRQSPSEQAGIMAKQPAPAAASGAAAGEVPPAPSDAPAPGTGNAPAGEVPPAPPPAAPSTPPSG